MSYFLVHYSKKNYKDQLLLGKLSFKYCTSFGKFDSIRYSF